MIYDGKETDGEPSTWLPPASMTLWDAFDSISAMTFAYQGQSMLLEIAAEMEDGRDFPKAVKVSCASLVGLYACAMAVGYYYRGQSVASFLPDSLDDGWLKTLIGLVLYFHVVVTYLVNNQPLAKKVYDALWPEDHSSIDRDGHAKDSAKDPRDTDDAKVKYRWAAITSLFLLWSYLIANLIPWFSDFQNIMGSMLGAPVMFGFPVLFYVLDARQAATIQASPLTKAALAFVGGVVLPLTWIIGTIAAFVSLFADWSSAGGVFSCTPSGYAR